MSEVRKTIDGEQVANDRRLRAAGLRSFRVWATDTQAKDFKARAREQASAVRSSEQAAADQAFVDLISEDSNDRRTDA